MENQRAQRILLVEDDAELAALLADYLRLEGYGCEVVDDGRAALARLLNEDFQAAVLDVMLPGLNGLEVLRRLREKKNVPVVMLTARGDDADRIIGLEIGADDYLPKPCHPRVLLAHLQAVLRRAGAGPAAQADSLEVGGVCLYRRARRINVDGREVVLTGAEFSLLEILMRAAGETVTKDALSEQGLHRRLLAYDRSVDMHISNLRRKLGPYGNGAPRIVTVRNSGYLFAMPV
ncbi:MAG: response regulator transcription factor [Betaproteobacteria bacterium]|nr:response regulator transcription factor [Betaproteobacteria bacterium]